VRQGDQRRAEADLQASVELLPTAAAMNELGALALQRNDRAAAMGYYEVAASAPGAAGEQARAAYARLDITENPARYVEIQPFVSEGRVGARITNRAPMEVGQVVIEFRAVVGGQQVTRAVTVSRLAAGQTADIDSTIALPAGAVLAANQLAVGLRSLRTD